MRFFSCIFSEPVFRLSTKRNSVFSSLPSLPLLIIIIRWPIELSLGLRLRLSRFFGVGQFNALGYSQLPFIFFVIELFIVSRIDSLFYARFSMTLNSNWRVAIVVACYIDFIRRVAISFLRKISKKFFLAIIGNVVEIFTGLLRKKKEDSFFFSLSALFLVNKQCIDSMLTRFFCSLPSSFNASISCDQD